MNYLKFFSSVAIVALLVGCEKQELTSDLTSEYDIEIESKKGKSVSKSILGTISYSVDPINPNVCNCNPGSIPGPLFIGSGNVSHLGLSTASVSSCVVLGSFIPDTQIPQNIWVDNSCATLVAANGDELYLDPQSYNLIFNPNCLCHEGNSVVDVVGGTGRFANASGTLNVNISQDFNYVVTSNWSGTISY